MTNRRQEAAHRLRSLTRVAYTAAAGHLEVDPEDEEHRAVRAWPNRRQVMTVLVLLALVVGGLAVRHAAAGPEEAEIVGVIGADAEGVDGGRTGHETTRGPEPGSAGTPHDGAGTSPAGTPGADQGAGDPGADEAPTGAGAPRSVVVHVAGAVARPGVVALAPGARVADAVEAAGGAAPEADLAAVNLARPLVDGEQVYVPVLGEEPRAAPPAPPAAPPGGAGEATAGPAADGGPVDLNTASAAQLESLPGIGPALAGRIVDHREQHGGFSSVEQLQDVSGIGPVLMDRLRDLVTV